MSAKPLSSETPQKIDPTLVAGHALLEGALATGAVAGKARPIIESWRHRLLELSQDLHQKTLPPILWQAQMRNLYAALPVEELLTLIDFDLLASGKKPALPARDRHLPDRVWEIALPGIEGQARHPGFGSMVFGLEKGQTIVPHAHNDMVSAHLVLRGRFHVRTFNRDFTSERDHPGFLRLSRALDQSFGPGELLTMSDDENNVHWLVAESEQAFTFDTPILRTGFRPAYDTPAPHGLRIYVDPSAAPSDQSPFLAPILEPDDAFRKFR